jgi:GNAT superfamily N-acetyltransferase
MGAPRTGREALDPGPTPTVRHLAVGDLDGLRLAPRTVSPFDPGDGRSLLAAALRDGARVVAAITGDWVVGVAVAARAAGGREAAPDRAAGVESLLAVGVAPGWRGAGLARGLLGALVETRLPGVALEALVGVAERDVVEPADVQTRIAVARRLLEGAGFVIRAPSPDVTRDDPFAIAARLGPR